MFDIIEIAVMRLPLNGPETIVVIEHGNAGLDFRTGENRRYGLEILAQLPGLLVEWSRPSRLVDQCPVQLLLSAKGGTPLPVDHGVCAVRHGMPCHRPRLATVKSSIDRFPVDTARLGFDEPKVPFLEATNQVVEHA